MRKQKGFSLIELLIVVAIILIIAAIAIPNLLKSRQAANQAAAAATVRTLNTAETTYVTTYPTAGFAPQIGSLGPGGAACAGPNSTSACIIDGTLGTTSASSTWANKDAYWYNITLTTGDYTITAMPINGQAVYAYCSNSDASVKVQNPSANFAANGTTAPSAAITQTTCSGLPAQ